MTNAEKDVFDLAISRYGKDAQMLMLLEEMSELQKEICKDFRGKCDLDHLADEMADVEIMLDQMKLLFQNSGLVAQHREQKVRRLYGRLTEREGARHE